MSGYILPLMKLIDRYILRNVLVPFLCCMGAFLMLFVIFDLFDHLSDFLEAHTATALIFRYYLLLIPSVLIYIVPISILLGVLYGLSLLTRSNELTAMRASGVSLNRLMVPLILFGFIASLLLLFVNETVAPWSAYWTNQFIRAEKHKGDVSFYITHDLPYKHPTSRRIWMIGEFDRQTYDLKDIDVIQQREDGSDASRLHADAGQWLDGKWWFTGTTQQDLDEDGYPIGPPRIEERRAMTDWVETPRDLINVTKDPEFLSSLELIDFLHTHQHLSRDTLARNEVNLHYRLAMPWTCLIVTLMGLPIGAHTGRKGAFRGIAMALGFFFAFYVMINFGMALGKQQKILPWLSVWLPNILFFAIGLISVNRMR